MTGCAALSLAAGEELGATAPRASGWIVVEHPGPWGRKALLDSRFDEELGATMAELATRSAGSGTTVLLARHPSRPERDFDPGTRRAWIAHGATQRVLAGTIADTAELLAWDLEAVAAGSLPDFGEPTSELLVLACTNGARDACCAIGGRMLVDGSRVDGVAPPWLWESSHLGGHRLAPTALVLPTGYAHGRLDPDRLRGVAEHARFGRVDLTTARGRTCLAPASQAVDLAVRVAEGITEVAALQIEALDEHSAEARHRDGRAWRVRVELIERSEARPESCGAEPVPSRAWRVVELEQVAG